jgi:SHS2 domain-containing protein
LVAEADGVEALLVDWLNDLIYLFEARGVVCRRFSFGSWSETAYAAEAFGEPADESRHATRDLVKAATYHGLVVRRTEEGLEARVILDV